MIDNDDDVPLVRIVPIKRTKKQRGKTIKISKPNTSVKSNKKTFKSIKPIKSIKSTKRKPKKHNTSKKPGNTTTDIGNIRNKHKLPINDEDDMEDERDDEVTDSDDSDGSEIDSMN